MKKKQANILLVDDQEEILFSLKVLLRKHYEGIFSADSPRKILDALGENDIDVVLLDMNYRIGFEDGKEGIHWLKEISKFSPQTVVILMTAFGKVETAVEGLKSGAFDYILKPWDNDKLLQLVSNAVDESRKRKKKKRTEPQSNVPFIGKSDEILQAYKLADKVAITDANVLILGENGTGKSFLARYIHDNSRRKDKPFIHLDLGSLSENLFESELFGYTKGAFTDAKSDRMGRFEMAQNGTVFLDEIGNLPLHLQSKLLYVIQTKSVVRLGESVPRPLNVRLITATNINIHKEVSEKHFREDLLYRINTMEIELPSLRKRKNDIADLANFLLEKMKSKYEKADLVFDEKLLGFMESYPWRGNIREMENKIERAVILADNKVISINELDIVDVPFVEDETSAISVNDFERIQIEKTLLKHNGNISKAAQDLNLSRPALYRRMEKYNLRF
ncbi:MAG: sigma-54 dependent transcriptional regulator [Flavobacteriaceae bacterium]